MRPAIGFKTVTIASPRGKLRHFKWDGQPMRAPRKGEFFLSGAIVSAYEAKADMTTPYYIAQEVTK
jgi:hypothetical protein